MTLLKKYFNITLIHHLFYVEKSNKYYINLYIIILIPIY